MKYYQTLENYHAEYGQSDTLYTLDSKHFLPWADFVKTLKVHPRFVKVLQVIDGHEGETVYCEE